MNEKNIQLAVFSVGKAKLAMDIMKIREILKFQDVTELPGTPEFVEGVIDLRGLIIPIIDLRKRLGISDKEYDKKTRILVAIISGQIVGLIVDEVHEVIRLTEDEIKPPPKISGSFSATYIAGICDKDKEIIIILNYDKLMSTSEIVEFEKINKSLISGFGKDISKSKKEKKKTKKKKEVKKTKKKSIEDENEQD